MRKTKLIIISEEAMNKTGYLDCREYIFSLQRPYSLNLRREKE